MSQTVKLIRNIVEFGIRITYHDASGLHIENRSIECEVDMVDQVEIGALQQQIAAHRSTLNVYLQQLGILGQAYVPPHVIAGIRMARSEIQQKKSYLRSIGVPIDDQQNDFDAVADIKSIQADEEYTSQVKLYRDISRSLQALAFTGDILWNYATPESLGAFKRAIREVKQVIEVNAVYFETADLKELRKAVTIFEQFTRGKERVLPLLHDNGGTGQADMGQELRRQISTNARYKRRYEDLVEKIRISFKARIV
jgi:hypothetical protein